MQIAIKDIEGIETPEQACEKFAERRRFIDAAFREMAILDTASTDAAMLLMLEGKIAEVKARRPDLSDTEAYIVAGRLLKQFIACYQSALSQLLP
jgi:hypothetical protein